MPEKIYESVDECVETAGTNVSYVSREEILPRWYLAEDKILGCEDQRNYDIELIVHCQLSIDFKKK